MRIDQKLKTITDQIDGLSFEYNYWALANFNVSKKALPICICIPPTAGAIITKNGNYRDRMSTLIAFLDAAEFDADGKINEIVIDKMKAVAKAFIAKLNRAGFFKMLPDNIPYSVTYDKLDDNLAGIVIELQLEEITGTCENYL